MPSGHALAVSGLTKRFGGLIAVDNLSVELESGKLNAIIGPNGAGKTTLFNLITGELTADTGRIDFGGCDLVSMRPYQIVRQGVSRTLQIKSVFGGLSVADNVRIAVLTHEKAASPFRSARSYQAAASRAELLIAEVGLADRVDDLASTLSYGDVALLEIALALAAEPKLLLLDEPVCGMGPQETERAVNLIRSLARRMDIVLIEHDMEVVFDIADVIVVMAQGAVLAKGTATEIAADPVVQEAYLGAPEDE